MGNIVWALCLSVQFLPLIALSTNAMANGAPYEANEVGGIAFKREPDVSIEEEVLYISQDQIRVSYLFHSAAREPINIDIAFPSATSFTEGPNTTDTLRFKVTANGVKVKTKRSITYWAEQRDITPILRRAGAGFGKEYNLTLSDAVKAALTKADVPFYCEPKNQFACRAGDQWQEVYTWSQMFQPGFTRIEVAYKPFTGKEIYMSPGRLDNNAVQFSANSNKKSEELTWRQLFCVDQPVEQALRRFVVERTQTTDGFELPMLGTSVYYVLETARYWNGPIKKFHLIVEKKHPSEILAFCPAEMNPPNGIKTSPTRFEWEATNYAPKGMIRALFLTQQK